MRLPATAAALLTASLASTTARGETLAAVSDVAPAPTVALTLPAPTRAQLTAVAGGTIARIRIDRAPASVERVVTAGTAQSPDVIARFERINSSTAYLEVAARRGRLVCHLLARQLGCRPPRVEEEQARLTATIRDPFDPGDHEAAGKIEAAEKLMAAGDTAAARKAYEEMRRRYSTRGISEIRLGDLAWLGGDRETAVRAWRSASFMFRRRTEGRIAAARWAAAEYYGSRALPDGVADGDEPQGPLAANLALAEARLLGDAGRFHDALERLDRDPPAALGGAFRQVRNDLVAAGIRLSLLRGDPFSAAVLFRRHLSVVRAHPERVDLQIATADSLIELDLGPEAIEVVNDVLFTAQQEGKEGRVGAWIERIRVTLKDPPVSPEAEDKPHPLSERLESLSRDVAVLARRPEARP